MKRSMAIAGVMMIISSLVAVGRASAQEGAGPGKFEVTLIPAGATFFLSKDEGPSFRNFNVAGTAGVNFNRVVGVEGEVTGSFGLSQDLGDLPVSVDTPNMLSYTGNVVVGLSRHSLVPYVTGGAGGLTVYTSRDLGLDSNVGTFLTGNVGGGVKWYQSGGRWGLRGDYRFQVVRSKDDAPTFFGQETREGNRIYGGVIVNVVK
jgi:hypothetical protein